MMTTDHCAANEPPGDQRKPGIRKVFSLQRGSIHRAIINRVRPARIALSLLCLVGFLFTLTDSAMAAKNAARVLLVTGEDYPGHKWKETYPVLKAGLVAFPGPPV